MLILLFMLVIIVITTTILITQIAATALPKGGGDIPFVIPRQWVAVGASSDNENIIYSSDEGKTWISSTGSTFGEEGFGAASDNNGNWVAVGVAGRSDPVESVVFSSDNGESWIAGARGSEGDPVLSEGGSFVATDKEGMWVAVGEDSGGENIIYSSNNGETWDIATGSIFGSGGYGNSVATSRGIWIAVGAADDGESNIVRSIDGKEWSVPSGYTFTSGGTGNSITTDGNGNWAATGEGGISRSTDDGVSWTEGTGSVFEFGTGISIATDGNNNYVAAGTNNDENIIYLPDGASVWSHSAGETFGGAGIGTSIATDSIYGNSGNTWVTVGSDSSENGNNIVYSIDNGKTWTESTGDVFGIGGTGWHVATNTETWIAVGASAIAEEGIVRSVDGGVSWEISNGSIFGEGAGNFVTVG